MSPPALTLFPGSHPAEFVGGEKETVASDQVKPRGAECGGQSVLTPRHLPVPHLPAQAVLAVIAEVCIAETGQHRAGLVVSDVPLPAAKWRL